MSLVLVLLGCDDTVTPEGPLGDADRRAVQIAVVARLLREMNPEGHYASCLEVGTWYDLLSTDVLGSECADPEGDRDALLAEFGRFDLSAHPREECGLETVEGSWMDCLTVEETGQDAYGYAVGCPSEAVDGRVTIGAAYGRCDLNAAGFTCTVRWDQGAWTVEVCQMDWIA